MRQAFSNRPPRFRYEQQQQTKHQIVPPSASAEPHSASPSGRLDADPPAAVVASHAPVNDIVPPIIAPPAAMVVRSDAPSVAAASNSFDAIAPTDAEVVHMSVRIKNRHMAHFVRHALNVVG